MTGTGEFCACALRAGNDHFDAVRRANLLARAQLEVIADLLSFDFGKQIFVCRDAQRWRPGSPFDVERAPGMNFREVFNRALIGDNVTVPSHSDPLASGHESETSCKKYKRDLLHVK